MAGLLLFARIGWMKRYAGSQHGDERAISNAAYLRSNKGPGAERFNFINISGKVYGYFRRGSPKGIKPTIDLGRIKPGFTADVLRGATIVFVARRHPGGG